MYIRLIRDRTLCRTFPSHWEPSSPGSVSSMRLGLLCRDRVLRSGIGWGFSRRFLGGIVGSVFSCQIGGGHFDRRPMMHPRRFCQRGSERIDRRRSCHRLTTGRCQPRWVEVLQHVRPRFNIDSFHIQGGPAIRMAESGPLSIRL